MRASRDKDSAEGQLDGGRYLRVFLVEQTTAGLTPADLTTFRHALVEATRRLTAAGEPVLSAQRLLGFPHFGGHVIFMS